MALIGKVHHPQRHGTALFTVQMSLWSYHRRRCHFLWKLTYEELASAIDPCQYSEFQGVDIYIQTLTFIERAQ